MLYIAIFFSFAFFPLLFNQEGFYGLNVDYHSIKRPVLNMITSIP